MSDIRKLLDIVVESSAGASTAGAVATVAQPLGATQKRVEEDGSKPAMPEVLEYGMWENSALTTSSKLKKERRKAAKVVKSIYGEDEKSVDKGDVAESKKTKKLVVEDSKTPEYYEKLARKHTADGQKGTRANMVYASKMAGRARRAAEILRKGGTQENALQHYQGTDKDQGVAEGTLNELSPKTLASYKKKASEYASSADKAADSAFKSGEHELGKQLTDRANKKFSGIIKATNKQFDHDAKGMKEDQPVVPGKAPVPGVQNGVTAAKPTTGVAKPAAGAQAVAGKGDINQLAAALKQALGKVEAQIDAAINESASLFEAAPTEVSPNFDSKFSSLGGKLLDLVKDTPVAKTLKDILVKYKELVHKYPWLEKPILIGINAALTAALVYAHTPIIAVALIMGSLETLYSKIVHKDSWRKALMKGGISGALAGALAIGGHSLVDWVGEYAPAATKLIKYLVVPGVESGAHAAAQTGIESGIEYAASKLLEAAVIASSITSTNRSSKNKKINESAYSAGVQDGLSGQRNRRASSVYGPEVGEYDRGYAAGLKQAKEKGPQGDNVPPFADIPSDVLRRALKSSMKRLQEIQDEVDELTRGNFRLPSYEKKRIPPELKAESNALQAKIQKIENALNSRNEQQGQLQEMDLILNPASISRRNTDLVSKSNIRTDHEVEMAKSDLYQASKNAAEIYKLIRDVQEEQGLEGWVQEKIIKAADYLNTVREYMEGKCVTDESMDGVGPSTRMFTSESSMDEGKTGPGLWANIRKRKASGKRMRKPGEEGAPTDAALKAARRGSK